MTNVVPSLPAQSFAEITTLAGQLQGVAPELQIDIVDGIFAPTKAWPFVGESREPAEALADLIKLTGQFTVEVDCMVAMPEQYLDILVAATAARVIIHWGSTDQHHEISMHAKTHKYKLGLAFTNDVSRTVIEEILPLYDYIQVMGIAKVGSQGQPFDERTIATIEYFHSSYPELEIAVDGSVNVDTILLLKNAGATRLAPGSAIAKQTDPKAAYSELLAMVQ